MTATASVSLTGDPYIDGVLSGTRWGVSSLTYSFPTSAAYYEYSGEPGTNFEAFTAVQQDAVRKVLANYSAIANLTFTEVAETSSQHATLRYAESDSLSPGTAWAYFPNTWPTRRRHVVQQLEPLLRQPDQGKLRLFRHAPRDRARDRAQAYARGHGLLRDRCHSTTTRSNTQ